MKKEHTYKVEFLNAKKNFKKDVKMFYTYTSAFNWCIKTMNKVNNEYIQAI